MRAQKKGDKEGEIVRFLQLEVVCIVGRSRSVGFKFLSTTTLFAKISLAVALLLPTLSAIHCRCDRGVPTNVNDSKESIF